MSYESIERGRAAERFSQWAGEGMRARAAAEGQADANLRRRARLGHLAHAFRQMLSEQPDLWDTGFDVDLAAGRCLPIVESLIRER